jgi:transposase InsO family protein
MRVIAAVTAFAVGGSVNVSEVCRTAGVSRKTFYKWVARYRAEGLAGLEERSRCPRSSPHRTDAVVEDAVVACRQRLAGQGLDHGAMTVHWHLGQDPMLEGRVPSVATIHRVLVRRGLIVPQPKKRPHGSWRRFEAPAPNEWWQIDAMDWVTRAGLVRVFNIIDDHSRVAVRSRAVTTATTVEAWTTFCQGAQQWGLPAGVLSDNGMCFSGKLRGFEVLFEANLRDAGVRPFTGRAFHPQTTGKVERFQQTLKKWLRQQPLAGHLDELQNQLDRFVHVYNHERPHQGIGRTTPATRWHARPARGPAAEPLPHPNFTEPRAHHTHVSNNGVIDVGRNLSIGVPIVHAGAPATAIVDDHYASVFINDHLVRHLKIDHTRRYQPVGRPNTRTHLAC